MKNIKKWEWSEKDKAIVIYENGDYQVGPDNQFVVVSVRVGEKNASTDIQQEVGSEAQ